MTTSTRTLASFTLEKKFIDEFSEATTKMMKEMHLKQSIRTGVVLGWSDACMLWIFGLMFWFGGIRIVDGGADFNS